jgi:hypothetical protein
MYNVQYTVYFTVSDLRQGPCIYIPQEQGGPVIPPGTGYLSPNADSLSFSCLRYSLGPAPTENTVSRNTPIVVYLPIRCLETGSSIAARIRICCNVFTNPLLSNELFRVSPVMSQYLDT